jgi:hypothetical protein
MVAATHETEFNLVLHIFNVEGATAWTRTQQSAHHGLGELVNGFTHAGGRGTLRAVHS